METLVPRNIGLRRIALKNLEPDLDSILIVAVIIGKNNPGKFLDKTKENEEYRGVWRCTVRDSQRDYINVTFWGPSDEVSATNDKFYTGDVGKIEIKKLSSFSSLSINFIFAVELRNPRIYVRKFNETSEQFAPIVTSPFYLTINEQSQIVHHCGDTLQFTKLLNFPTKPLSGYVSIRDIQTGGENMKG